jgi:fructokinase
MAFFMPFVRRGEIATIGFVSFGPVDLYFDSPTNGSVTTTPKLGWAYSDMIGKIRITFGIPVEFELDVNAAAFGEYFLVPENRQCDLLAYFTIGAGIGAGIIVNGQLVHGLVHLLKKTGKDGIIKACGITTASDSQMFFSVEADHETVRN